MSPAEPDPMRKVDPDEMHPLGVPMTFALLWASLCQESRAIVAKDADEDFRALLDALSEAYPAPGAERKAA